MPFDARVWFDGKLVHVLRPAVDARRADAETIRRLMAEPAICRQNWAWQMFPTVRPTLPAAGYDQSRSFRSSSINVWS